MRRQRFARMGRRPSSAANAYHIVLCAVFRTPGNWIVIEVIVPVLPGANWLWREYKRHPRGRDQIERIGKELEHLWQFSLADKKGAGSLVSFHARFRMSFSPCVHSTDATRRFYASIGQAAGGVECSDRTSTQRGYGKHGVRPTTSSREAITLTSADIG